MHDHVIKVFAEEVEGLRGYYKMRNVARERGDSELAFWLQQIIEDERSHVMWIYSWLKDHGEVTKEVKEMYEEVCEW